MNPRQFLLIAGGVLVVVGIAGFVGLIGPTPERSVFGGAWYFTPGENWAHLLVGAVALVFAYLLGGWWQKWLSVTVGVLGLFAALWGFLVSGGTPPNFYGANLEHPADNVLHLVIGLWALWVAFWGREKEEHPYAPMSPPPSTPQVPPMPPPIH